MRLVRRAFWAAVLLAAAVFAVANMQTVEVRIDPIGLEFEALRPIFLPLAVVIFGALGLGLVAGVTLEFDRGRSSRREQAAQRAEIRRLSAEVERMYRAMKAADHPDSARLPATRG